MLYNKNKIVQWLEEVMAKLSKTFIQKHRYWDFDGDGRFPTNRIKGKDKQILKKQRRYYEKKEAKKEIEMELYSLL
jgi:hypothetical protein